MFLVAKTIEDAFKEINQWTKVGDYTKSLGFTCRGRNVMSLVAILCEVEIAKNGDLVDGVY